MTSPAPLLACPGVPSYATLHAAWTAIQTDRGCAGHIPFRCSTCRVWHLSESPQTVPLTVGRVRAAGQGHESTLDNELVTAGRGGAFLSTFWRYVVSGLGDECWLWSGALDSHGYGCYGNPKRIAHRLSYEWLVGPIPEGLTLDHLCRNRNCVNPGHLEPATRWENVRRGTGPSAVHARKTHCIYGHPLEGENLYVTSRGWRVCRECRRRRNRKAQAQARARARGPAEPYVTEQAA